MLIPESLDSDDVIRDLETKARSLAESNPVSFAEYYLEFSPDPWQRRFLRSKADRIILNCSRQSGKSQTAALLALYEAVTIPKSTVVIESPSERQSIEMMMKFSEMLGRLSGVDLRSDTKLSAYLGNGSRVLALPGSEKTVRGISAVTLLIIDEAARVPDDLYRSLRPMLAVSHGRLVLLSTPFGRQGFFYNSWQSGIGWTKFEVPATECPRITSEFLEEERREQGEAWYRQEYMCDFMSMEDARIDASWLKSEEYAPQNCNIVMGVDLAISEKAKADYTAMVVMGRDEDGLLHVLDAKRIKAPFQTQLNEIIAMASKWHPSTIGVEDIQYQRAMVQSLSAQTNYAVFPVRPDRDKISRFAPLEARYQNGQVYHNMYLPREFEAELLMFPAGNHDDFVDAMSICWATLAQFGVSSEWIPPTEHTLPGDSDCQAYDGPY